MTENEIEDGLIQTGQGIDTGVDALGKTDTVTKEYLKNPRIFADAFNKYLYHGRQVIKPEDLRELDTTETAVPYGSGGAGVPEQKYRDLLKLMMTDGKVAYCILGIESQRNVHYAMPVRNGVYDFLHLAHQVSETAKSHKEKDTGKNQSVHLNNNQNNDNQNGNQNDGSCNGGADGMDKNESYHPSPDEYLSGFYKTDRLLPVLTLVIFFGNAPWDGPLTLKEMYSPVDEAILPYMPDYRVNLIAPGQMTEQEIEEFASSLKEVLLYIKYSGDKAKLLEVTQKDTGFRSLERQAVEVINATTNSGLKYPEREDVVDVCTAIQELMADNKQEGKMEGAVEAYKELNISIQEAIRRIADKFSLSLQQSEQEVMKYWN